MFFFFFNDTATTEIYTLSLHDALPISDRAGSWSGIRPAGRRGRRGTCPPRGRPARSEEHTSELQSPCNLVCRLLLEKKKKKIVKKIMRTRSVMQYDSDTDDCRDLEMNI